MKIHTLDLGFRRPGTVAAYLVESAGEFALVETGPDSTWGTLVAELGRLGLTPRSIRNVFVTHVHLDHAGAAWRLAREGAVVWVHPKGVRHLSDPSKLLASAVRIYQDRMEELWGTLEPIPEDRIRVAEDGASVPVGRTAFHVLATPGHAVHHNVYLVEGNAFTGDVGGVAIGGGPVLAPTPPPDIHLGDWGRSIAKIRAARPDALYPTHFGRVERPESALDDLESQLHAWAGFVRAGLEKGQTDEEIVPEFEAWVTARLREAGVEGDALAAYRTALPFAMNVPGLTRYWQKTWADPAAMA